MRVIFYLMHLSEPELLFSEADIFHDFALTGVLLGILLFVTVVPLTRMVCARRFLRAECRQSRRRGVSRASKLRSGAARGNGCRHCLADGRRCFRLRASAAAAYRDGSYAAQGPCVRLRRCRRRVHHDLLRRALWQKRGLGGRSAEPRCPAWDGRGRQSAANRRHRETQDALRLFFVSWSR